VAAAFLYFWGLLKCSCFRPVTCEGGGGGGGGGGGVVGGWR
jgi:hypothetical protein